MTENQRTSDEIQAEINALTAPDRRTKQLQAELSRVRLVEQLQSLQADYDTVDRAFAQASTDYQACAAKEATAKQVYDKAHDASLRADTVVRGHENRRNVLTREIRQLQRQLDAETVAV